MCLTPHTCTHFGCILLYNSRSQSTISIIVFEHFCCQLWRHINRSNVHCICLLICGVKIPKTLSGCGVKYRRLPAAAPGGGSVAAPASAALANGGIWASPFGCKFAGLPLGLRAKTAADFFGWHTGGRLEHDAKFVVHDSDSLSGGVGCDLQRVWKVYRHGADESTVEIRLF